MKHGKDAGKTTIPRSYPYETKWNDDPNTTGNDDQTAQGTGKPDPGNAFDIDLIRPRYSEAMAGKRCTTFMIYAFIQNSRWIPTQGATNGTSWLELFAMFHLSGGRSLKEDFEENIFHEAGRLLSAYKAFKNNFTQIVQAWMPPEQRFMFAPARVNKARLAPYGITKHVPCIKAERITNGNMASELHKALVSLTTAWTKGKESALKEGNLKVTPAKIPWRGKIPWRQWAANSMSSRALRTQAEKHMQDAEKQEAAQQEKANMQEHAGRNIARQEEMRIARHAPSFICICPTCAKAKELGRTNLRKKGGSGWASLKCASCHRAHKASSWKCICGEAWIKCSIHFKQGIQCRAPEPQKKRDAKKEGYAGDGTQCNTKDDAEAMETLKRKIGVLGQENPPKRLKRRRTMDKTAREARKRRANAAVERSGRPKCYDGDVAPESTDTGKTEPDSPHAAMQQQLEQPRRHNNITNHAKLTQASPPEEHASASQAKLQQIQPLEEQVKEQQHNTTIAKLKAAPLQVEQGNKILCEDTQNKVTQKHQMHGQKRSAGSQSAARRPSDDNTEPTGTVESEHSEGPSDDDPEPTGTGESEHSECLVANTKYGVKRKLDMLAGSKTLQKLIKLGRLDPEIVKKRVLLLKQAEPETVQKTPEPNLAKIKAPVSREHYRNTGMQGCIPPEPLNATGHGNKDFEGDAGQDARPNHK
jgi:hypothetical protein